MATLRSKLSAIKPGWRPLPRLLSFFRRLQWKLTLAYTLSTVITVIILALVGLALLWYLYFHSAWLPNQVADGLIMAGPELAPYLDQTPPDQSGLNNWLQKVILDDNLVINLPADENGENKDEKLPAQFGRIVSVVIVEKEGKVLAAAPDEVVTVGVPLQAQILQAAVPGFQAALRGEINPAMLAIRHTDNHMIAAAPIFGSNDQVVGALFAQLVPPLKEAEFLQFVLQETILPVALGMLVVGVVAGILFGFFIARSLTRRLQALDNVTEAWSQGNFEVLARDASGDELGQLARQLNHMALQLQNLLQTRQELATLEERNRLARDLHDSVKQQFFATAMQIGAAQALLLQQPAAAQTHLAEAERLAHQAQQELTSLIRELRPAALEGKGLAAALQDYLADWSRQNRVPAEIRIQGERPLPLVIEQTLFRVAQEALSNIYRHSGATATEIHLAFEGPHVMLTIVDNGQGFQMGAVNGKGLGLRSMRERVESLGGRLAIETGPNQGTKLEAQLTTA